MSTAVRTTLPVYNVRVNRYETETGSSDSYTVRAMWHAPIGENRQCRVSGGLLAQRVVAVELCGTIEAPDGATAVIGEDTDVVSVHYETETHIYRL